ncbi:MAG: hypothetical protein FWF57_00140 [Defluviitaleaceae bacterium]|nr:hypothetical protein [Defluviitaleaceae bacterium]
MYIINTILQIFMKCIAILFAIHTIFTFKKTTISFFPIIEANVVTNRRKFMIIKNIFGISQAIIYFLVSQILYNRNDIPNWIVIGLILNTLLALQVQKKLTSLIE